MTLNKGVSINRRFQKSAMGAERIKEGRAGEADLVVEIEQSGFAALGFDHAEKLMHGEPAVFAFSVGFQLGPVRAFGEAKAIGGEEILAAFGVEMQKRQIGEFHLAGVLDLACLDIVDARFEFGTACAQKELACHMAQEAAVQPLAELGIERFGFRAAFACGKRHAFEIAPAFARERLPRADTGAEAVCGEAR